MLVARALGVAASRRRRRVPAHGRRLRRQGDADVAVSPASPRSLARKTGRAVKLRLDRDDDMRSTGKRHAFDYRYDVGFDDEGRILARSTSRSPRAAAFPPTCRVRSTIAPLFHVDNAYWLPNVAIHSLSLPDAHGVRHRVSRLRRPAGHVRDRDRHRRHRALARPRPARRAQGQPLRHDRAQRHAVRHGRRGQHRAGADRRARASSRAIASGARAIAAWNRGQPGRQARHRADAGQVRHLVHGDALQPGRRAGPCVPRRQRAAQPRRHRDGPGPLHQGPAGRRRGARRRRSTRVRVSGVGHQQGAERLGDRRIVGQRHERHGRAQRRDASSRERLAAFAARAARSRHPSAVRFAGGMRDGRRAQRLRVRDARATMPTCAYPLSATGFYATPKIHYDRAHADRPSVLLFRVRRGGERSGARYADRRASPAARSTSCTTSARRSTRRSTAVRSKAASSRAGAGSPGKSCAGTPTAAR